MVMTSAWIHRYATRNRGWTKKQLAILGVAWPPRRGWLRAMVGREITEEQRAAFEHAHAQREAANWFAQLPADWEHRPVAQLKARIAANDDLRRKAARYEKRAKELRALIVSQRRDQQRDWLRTRGRR
jgi:hypothetical protein